jgi:hypothetical protein
LGASGFVRHFQKLDSLHVHGSINRLQIAHPVEDDGRKVRASCFDSLPVMPAWSEVLVLAELGFFQVIRARVGKLNL